MKECPDISAWSELLEGRMGERAALEMESSSVGTSLVRAEAAFEARYLELYGREEDL